MSKRINLTSGKVLSRVVLIILIFTTFFPFVMLINMSLKPTVLISTDFLSFFKDPYWTNYVNAFKFIVKPIINSFIVCGASLILILINVCLAGYAFGRMKFKGRKLIFSIFIAVMMVPVSITMVPQYLIVSKLNLVNTYWALIFPYVGSQQVLGIILAATTFQQMPQEIFDAAKIDGAGEFQILYHIGLPLLRPTLVTIGITTVIAMYNDYIWPTIVLTGGDDLKTFCQIVFNNSQGYVRTDIGLLAAAFVIGTIPLIIVTCFCLKYYLQGLVAGAVKG